ncbi:MAG: DsrE family protein, partial [Rhodocyclaceae bacterium]|nr:DsrE family protein [Rhodocyclaceae bacterium]
SAASDVYKRQGMLSADSIAANEVQDALATGVEFIACGNSMTAQKIERADLVEGATIAKAGYVEIMRRQQAGWVYLRP